VVVGVADIDRTVGTDDRAMRTVEAGRRGGAAIAARTLPAPGDRRDDPGRAVDQADRVVLGVDDQDVALGIERHLFRCVEYSGERRPAVTGIAAPRRAGDRIDDAGRGIDGAQGAALALEDIDGAVGAELDGAGAEDAGIARRPAVAAMLGL
jgi:hypothetical protein